MKNVQLNTLIAEYQALEKALKAKRNVISQFADGYHYRLVYHRYGNQWEETVLNSFEAVERAMRCYCADYEGSCDLYTNNESLINDENRDWGDIHIHFEQA